MASVVAPTSEKSKTTPHFPFDSRQIECYLEPDIV